MVLLNDDQVEYICRKLREDRCVFGGLQVVFVGDWFQLTPVANILNNDPGRQCFLADVWRDAIKHKVVLTEVMRQKDHKLIAAVNELERGFPSESTHRLMESLSRALAPGDKPLTLYGTNFEVDWHNASEISSLPGDVMIYRSTDSGVVSKLRLTTAKKVLSLKVNCPVILLRNLGQGLVNGLQGTVTRLDEDGPTVQFPACSMKLKTVMFSVVDSCNIGEAEREQFPIAPAFALTVHKAQGLTLPRLIVNCKNIFNPGQLGAAVGRAVGAAVLNYKRECSKRHQEEVYSFFDEPGLPVKDDDMSCCDEAAPEVPALSAEARYQDCQVQGILMSFKTDNAVTPQQQSINEAIVFLQRNPEKLKLFFEDQHQKITRLFTECGAGKKVKDETAFMKKFHAYLLTHYYQKSSRELLSPLPVNKLLLWDIITSIRTDVTAAQKSARSLQADLGSIHMDVTEGEADIPETGYSKVRYEAGFTVAKLKNHYMNLVRNSLHALRIKLVVKKQSIPLASQKCQENTNISDECFAFFLLLEKKRLPLYGQKYLDQYKSDLLTHIHSCVLANTSLFQTVAGLFVKFILAWFPTGREDIRCILEDLTLGCSIVTDLFTQIVNRYLNVTDSEFRRKLLDEMGRMKTLEHRKQVLLKKTSKVQGSALKDDKSKRKASFTFEVERHCDSGCKAVGHIHKGRACPYWCSIRTHPKQVEKRDILIESLMDQLQQL
ncbi:uncharacterized protein LOC124272960 [Haliotis rubra]|uniref:uncharacterized protein LOC124272960 n=1 Tax=Haliotis rubra TaxID=36100 RepID=UPI001EE59D4C|nr:uncharacterized protein LOC124272960 [Haliotis rubra]